MTLHMNLQTPKLTTQKIQKPTTQKIQKIKTKNHQKIIIKARNVLIGFLKLVVYFWALQV
jgi:hypothetical protein